MQDKLIHALMRDGKKTQAEKIVSGVLRELKRRTSRDPILIFTKALENIKPLTEVRSVRIAGNVYLVPVTLGRARQEALAIRWLVQAARGRKRERTMVQRLCNELLDGAYGRGQCVRKRDEAHRMAEANQAYIHFRW